MSDEKLRKFLKLCAEAEKCRICPDLADKKAVLSQLNGNINPKVFFIAEAPGRQGADRTRRPFYGDKSGENFQKFLDSIDLKRDEIFITNAVMCSPRKENGANRSPKKSEIKNCSAYLQRTIQLLQPKVVATLGSVALEALKAIEYHQISLRNDVGKSFEWNGRILVPLYHPSPQVIASHRRFDEQIQDFQTLKEFFEAETRPSGSVYCVENTLLHSRFSAVEYMKDVKLYWLPHCSTCKKAKDFIEKKGIEINEFRDIKEDHLTRKEVEKLSESVGGAENLFSRRAIKYREMGLHEREVSIEEMLDLMANEYTFIKRPVLVVGDKAAAGFSEKTYSEILEK